MIGIANQHPFFFKYMVHKDLVPKNIRAGNSLTFVTIKPYQLLNLILFPDHYVFIHYMENQRLIGE